MAENIIPEKVCVVYWLFDAGCSVPEKDGYVGVTNNLANRIRRHKRSKRFPLFRVKVLFEGSRHECSALEFNLRPNIGIGWNFGTGGKSTHGTLGKKLSLKTRERMRAVHAKRPLKEKRRLAKLFAKLSKGNKSRTGQKASSEERAKLSKVRLGNKNAVGNKNRLGQSPSVETRKLLSKSKIGNKFRLGKKHSAETRAKISMSRKGKNLGSHNNRNWLLTARRNPNGTWKSQTQGE